MTASKHPLIEEEKQTYVHWRDNLVLFIVCGVFARRKKLFALQTIFAASRLCRLKQTQYPLALGICFIGWSCMTNAIKLEKHCVTLTVIVIIIITFYNSR